MYVSCMYVMYNVYVYIMHVSCMYVTQFKNEFVDLEKWKYWVLFYLKGIDMKYIIIHTSNRVRYIEEG